MATFSAIPSCETEIDFFFPFIFTAIIFSIILYLMVEKQGRYLENLNPYMSYNVSFYEWQFNEQKDLFFYNAMDLYFDFTRHMYEVEF